MTSVKLKVKVQEVSGGSIAIGTAINRTQRYIDRTREHWAGTDQEYREWAREVMRGSLVNLADRLCVEAVS